MKKTQEVQPIVRILILFCATITIILLSRIITGKFFPEKQFENLIFQGALLMIVFGSTVQEFYFTRPSESMVNAFMGTITLLPVYQSASKNLWWVILGYCLLIFILGVVVTGLSLGKNIDEHSKRIVDKLYQPVVNFGRARIIFSIIFLYGLIEFYNFKSLEFLILILFWGIFIVIWPLGIPTWLSGILGKRSYQSTIGEVLRTDWPNIIHVDLKKDISWKFKTPKMFVDANENQKLVVPICEQLQGGNRIGTGVCVPWRFNESSKYERGNLYDIPENIEIENKEITQSLGGDKSSKVIGFVSKNSCISEIQFELLDDAECHEGMLIWCKIGNQKVFYQVTNGKTDEEAFEANRFGFQTGLAYQIGKLSDDKFDNFLWLPKLNTPVFCEGEDFGEKIIFLDKEKEFVFGSIPGTKIEIGGNIIDAIEYHTAILGVTGTGKTELGLEIISHVGLHHKVICIDPTAKYEEALKDKNPHILSLGEAIIKELENKIYTADTSDYGGKKQWGEVRQYVRSQYQSVITEITDFLKSENNIALLKLKDISNANATLYITELYLSCLMKIVRENPKLVTKVLIVLEEAHSTIPEPLGGIGTVNDDYKSVVSKIAQVALQGRKYGIGLLLIAQRTAHVSKSVLSQCNTIISFKCFDETSLKFLENVFGKTHVDALPNLPFLHAVVYGKAIKSTNPLIIAVPYDKTKLDHNY